MGPRGHGEKWGRPKGRGFKQEGPKKGARGRRALKDQGTKGRNQWKGVRWEGTSGFCLKRNLESH